MVGFMSFVLGSVFGKDGRSREAIFVTEGPVAQVFLPRQLHQGPAHWADADDSPGANTFDDEVGLKLDLDAAAAEGDFLSCLGDVEDGAIRGYVGGAVVTACMLQGVLGSIHLCTAALLEVGVEGGIHAAEQRRAHGRAAELAILDGINPGWHPAAPDEGFVRLGLKLGGVLDRGVVQPDVRDVEAGENASQPIPRCGLPSHPEQNGLPTEGFFPAGGPRAFGDQVRDYDALAAAPDAGSGVEGQIFLAGLAASACLRFAAGDDHPLVVLEFHFFELPDHSLVQAVAGLVFKEEDVVRGGCDTGATIMARVHVLVVDRQHRHGGNLRVGREEGPDVQHGAERDVAQIRRCAVIPDDAVGKHGEGVRIVSVKFTRPLHADAAAAVGMVHEHKFAPVGVRLFERGKLPRFGPEGFLRCGGCE